MPDSTAGTDFSIDSVLGESPRLFANKDLLSVGKVPESNRIVGREEEITNVALSLEDLIYNDVPDNIQIYGKTGAGKSLVARHVSRHIVRRARDNGVHAAHAYVDCNGNNTITKAARHLFTETRNAVEKLPQTDPASDESILPTPPESGVGWNRYLTDLWTILDEWFDGVIFILDEIDLLSEFNKLLHSISRVRENEEIDTYIGVITISNRMQFKQELNQRVKSSMQGVEFVFSPYTATQLEDILDNRRDAFQDEVLADEVIPRAAELAADEHGDARKAIELLNKAGMVARRQMDHTVTPAHLDDARLLVEADLLSQSIRTLPDQSKLVLYALTKLLTGMPDKSAYTTAEIYDRYQLVAKDVDANVLGYQRVYDLLDELSFIGITHSEKDGRGDRQGVKRDHELNHDLDVVLAATLEEDRRLRQLEGITDVSQLIT